jgi:hypothetical protein
MHQSPRWPVSASIAAWLATSPRNSETATSGSWLASSFPPERSAFASSVACNPAVSEIAWLCELAAFASSAACRPVTVLIACAPVWLARAMAEASTAASAAACSVLTGFAASAVLSTLARPTSAFVSTTAPVRPATLVTAPPSPSTTLRRTTTVRCSGRTMTVNWAGVTVTFIARHRG